MSDATPTRYFRKLVGEKCYLSPINPADAELYTEWLNDRDVVDGLGEHRTFSLGYERDLLDKLSKEPHNFAIVDAKRDELIGGCALDGVNQVDGTAGLGIFIGRKNLWGQGYGEEAVSLLTRFAFSDLNLNIVILTVFEFNSRAIRCYEKCGFREYGRLPRGKYRDGQYYDLIYMFAARPGFIEGR